MANEPKQKTVSIEVVRDELVIITFDQCQFATSVAAMDAIVDGYAEYKEMIIRDQNRQANGHQD